MIARIVESHRGVQRNMSSWILGPYVAPWFAGVVSEPAVNNRYVATNFTYVQQLVEIFKIVSQ